MVGEKLVDIPTPPHSLAVQYRSDLPIILRRPTNKPVRLCLKIEGGKTLSYLSSYTRHMFLDLTSVYQFRLYITFQDADVAFYSQLGHSESPHTRNNILVS